jgi:hypothetical protein
MAPGLGSFGPLLRGNHSGGCDVPQRGDWVEDALQQHVPQSVRSERGSQAAQLKNVVPIRSGRALLALIC